MSLPELFIRRPVTTTLIWTSVIFFGLVAYRALPVSDLPNVDFPTIQVSASLPGASPETMASSVATPLEKQFSTIAGIDSMTSANGRGYSSITVQFTLDRDIDAAAQDIQAAISKAGRQLPPNMPAPPSYQKVNPADQPILYLAVLSRTLPLYKVHEYAETLMAQRISMVPGVAQVSVYGAQKYAVRVQVNPDALASRGIGLDEVQSAIQRGNVNLPTGALYGRKQAFTVESPAQLFNASDYKPLIVSYRNGNPVRLGELGRVIDSVENDRTASWLNDERAMTLAIQRQPGTNTVAVVDDVKKLLPAFRAELPAAVELRTVYDRSDSIRESIDDVKFTLMLTICLVVMVIFVFLRNVTATLIPSVVLPASIIGTFAAMYMMNYSLDNLSLMALTLCVGFVVDDAIVMLENIVRHMEAGATRMQAALEGSKEIGFTIVSMTLSLVAVFIPVLFMGGIVGRLLREFAVTISVAILVSGAVSLTLTPMLASRFLRAGAGNSHGRLYRLSERFFDGMARGYDGSLRFVLRHRLTTVLATLLLLVATGYLLATIPKGFLPSQDTGQIMAVAEGAQDISFDAMVRYQQQAGEMIREHPALDTLTTIVGRGTVNSGMFFLRLKPRHQREQSADEMIQELRPKLAAVPGLNVFLQNPPLIRIGGQYTKSLYQLTLRGTDTREIYRWVPEIETRIRNLEGFQDVTTDLQINSPQVVVNIDRDRAQTMGISADTVQATLYSAFGDRMVSTIYTQSNQYQVILEVLPEYQLNPDALSRLYVRAATGRMVPLDAVATLRTGTGPLTVNHSGQLPSATVSFDLKPGFSIGDAASAVQQALGEMNIPQNISVSFQGAMQAFQQSFLGMAILLVVAVLVIYLVLGILYESFVHPLTILSGLPAAVVGALLTLKLFHLDLNLYAMVGLIMLFGIVKKNAIMMIDFALSAQRHEGKFPYDAICEGCRLRFRPIMMTTMSALFGTLPIALAFGAGAEARRPLGLAVVGGLIVSQLLTLYITPVIYLYMEDLRKKLRPAGSGGGKRLIVPANAGSYAGGEQVLIRPR